jgi:hypothetical protein
MVRHTNHEAAERIQDAVTPDRLFVTLDGVRYEAFAPDQAPGAPTPITGAYPGNIGRRGNDPIHAGKTNAQAPLPSRGAVAPVAGREWSGMVLRMIE